MAALARVLHKSLFISVRSAVRMRCSAQRPMLSMQLSQSLPQSISSELKLYSSKKNDLDKVIKPVSVPPVKDSDAVNVGSELTGDAKLKKVAVKKILNQFGKMEIVHELAEMQGLESKQSSDLPGTGDFFQRAFLSFRFFCLQSEVLPPDLHILLSDIINGKGNIVDVFPYFIRHAARVYPHIECMDSLRVISDLTMPPFWYPEARAMKRRIIYHAGPTNSGKTYHALERFREAESGVYCGPLRLLTSEVFRKTNAAGRACDLVTGEERHVVSADEEPATHVACTVEMSSVTTPYEVAVIDEIQMLRDPGRGWAWTRALLGLCAHELHVCGEAAAVSIVQDLAAMTGDSVEVRTYERLTPLTVLNKALEDFANVQPGDCIVCFNKNDIFHCTRQLESRNVSVAVIYGGLPAETKLAQAAKFNDPDDPCKVLVATDAIGMGLNLNIKRIVLFTVTKTVVRENGDKEITLIPPTAALQIVGRAGRYGTQWEHGHVTTFLKRDLPTLNNILKTPVESIQRAGLHPTTEQIEKFAYQLPGQSLANLIAIFVHICQMDDSTYFMCGVDVVKTLAESIEHLPLPLPVRYTFCCAPVNTQHTFCLAMFVKYARKFGSGEMATYEWLLQELGVPFNPPNTLANLTHLEDVYDSLDLYLWLSFRYPEMFPHPDRVQDMQKQLNEVIHEGVININSLLQNSPQDSRETERVSIINRRGKKAAKNSGKGGVSSLLKGMKKQDGFKNRTTWKKHNMQRNNEKRKGPHTPSFTGSAHSVRSRNTHNQYKGYDHNRTRNNKDSLGQDHEFSVSNKSKHVNFSEDSEMPDPMELFQCAGRKTQAFTFPTLRNGDREEDVSEHVSMLKAEEKGFEVFNDLLKSVNMFEQGKDANLTDTYSSSASNLKDTSSSMKDSSSSMKDTSSSIKDTSSSIKDTSSSIKDTSSSIKDTFSSIKDTSSSTNDKSSSIKDTSSSIDDASSESLKKLDDS